MQVTHQQDFVSHAVLSGNEAIAFGISDSPEFFQILSSTLYSDQILAVVRETMCNAWDSHIDAGRTDVPIVVTLKDNKLTIRDFGKGIHHDRMGAVYGTYGASTKTNDGKQTGGFGLGCKAPFAYVDHFDVSSCHEGTKTLYALSKSSAEKMGKPGIMPIVSFPTTETGMEVSLDVESKDFYKFRDLIEQIAFNGEMNVKFNGAFLPTMPMSSGKHGWIITDATLASQKSIMNVRYGNVIYPVNSNPAYDTLYTKVIDQIHKAGHRYSGPAYTIVFQAPPHSISVTPSRESLSMQEHTINTLKGLMESFLSLVQDNYDTESRTLISQKVSAMASKEYIGQLLRSDSAIPKLNTDTTEISGPIKTVRQLVEHHMLRDYSLFRAVHDFDTDKRLGVVLDLKFGKRGHIEELREFITEAKPRPPAHSPYEWFKRRILRPLVRDMVADPVMTIDNLYVTCSRWAADDHLWKATKYTHKTFGNYIPLQRNIVALTCAKKDIIDRINKFPQMKELGFAEGVYVYHTPYAKTKLQAIRDFFIQRGFILLDMTVTQPWDAPKPVRVKAEPKKKLAGYPALSGVVRALCLDRIDNCFMDDSPRVENPACYKFDVQSRASHRSLTLGHFTGVSAKYVVDLFGSECAVITTETQREKCKAAGLPTLEDFVATYVTKEVTTSPQFLAYWPDSLERARGHKAGQASYEDSDFLMFDRAEIRNALDLKASLTRREQKILDLWQCIESYRHLSVEIQPSIQAAKDLITALPVNKAAKDIVENYNGENLLSLLSIREILTVLRKPNLPQEQLDRVVKIILLALKG